MLIFIPVFPRYKFSNNRFVKQLHLKQQEVPNQLMIYSELASSFHENVEFELVHPSQAWNWYRCLITYKYACSGIMWLVDTPGLSETDHLWSLSIFLLVYIEWTRHTANRLGIISLEPFTKRKNFKTLSAVMVSKLFGISMYLKLILEATLCCSYLVQKAPLP